MFCALLRPRYQVSVYRTIGPLVLFVFAFLLLLSFIFLSFHLSYFLYINILYAFTNKEILSFI